MRRAAYQVVCVTKATPAKCHITGVQTHDGRSWTAQEVRTALEQGTTFHTVGPESGLSAAVGKTMCPYCKGRSICSRGTVAADNDVNSFTAC